MLRRLAVQNVFFRWFYIVFTFSMHLAFWLIRFVLGGAHVALEIANVDFSHVFTMFFALQQGRRRDGVDFKRQWKQPPMRGRGGVNPSPRILG